MNKNKENLKGIKRGKYIELLSLAYNIIEVVISMIVGIATGSSALISWVVDSLIEANSAGFMIWRQNGE